MKPIYYLLFLILCLSLLTACDNKYPTANIPDEPLAKPLEIIIEPKKVAMTSSWAAGIKEDGTLWTWGSGQGNLASELGVDPTPLPVKGINDAVAISAVIQHMLLLRKDGSVWGWGDNGDGQIDPNSNDYFVLEPRRIEGVEGVVDIVAGIQDSFFLNDKGEVYTIGLNEKGWTNGINKPNTIAIKIPNLTNIVRVGSLGNVLVALNNQGEIYTTGIDWQSLGRDLKERSDHSEIAFYPADKVKLPHKVVDFFVDDCNVGVLLETGEVWVWGANTRAMLALSTDNRILTPTKHPSLNQVINIGVGSAVTKNGDLYLWGEQGFGKSQNSISVTNYRKPVRIMQNVNPVELIYGMHTSAVMLNNGEFWAWRDNDKGQRGTGQVVETFYKDYVLTPEKSLFTTY